MSPAVAHLSVVDTPAEPDAADGFVDMVRRRIAGTYRLDPWGLDDDVTQVAGQLARLRWSADVRGLEHLPQSGPALLVANRRLGWSEPVVVASALLHETGMIVRPAGGIDFDPLGGLFRRLGAIPARPAEVGAALRAGNVVLVPTRREPLRNRAGHLPIELLAPAVAAGVPLVPVAVIGWEFKRRWTVRIGEAVRTDGASVDARDEARRVGAAAVTVARTLDGLLADAHEHDLASRLLMRLSARMPRPDATRWEVD